MRGMLLAYVPGDAAKADFFALIVDDEVGGKLYGALLTILADNLPDDIGYATSGGIDSVEVFKRRARIFLIHELPEVVIVDLGSRMSEDTTECIVKIRKIPAQIRFIESISDILDKYAITLMVSFRVSRVIGMAGWLLGSMMFFHGRI